jgi:hypothetical protein
MTTRLAAVFGLAVMLTAPARQAQAQLAYFVAETTHSFAAADPDDPRSYQLFHQRPRFTGGAGPAALAAINAEVDAAVTRDLDDTNPWQHGQAMSDGVLDAYADQPDCASCEWWESVDATVLTNEGGVVVVQVAFHAYTGGAHNMAKVAFLNFDAATGKRLGLGAVIAKADLAEATRAAERAFRAARDLAPDADLNAAGFTFPGGAFALASEFAITTAGLRLHYDAYDIAPYALGETDFVMPWDDLAEVVRHEGTLGVFLNR